MCWLDYHARNPRHLQTDWWYDIDIPEDILELKLALISFDMLCCVGEEPTELLAEPCAINSFDIDRQNPSVCRTCVSVVQVLGNLSCF